MTTEEQAEAKAELEASRLEVIEKVRALEAALRRLPPSSRMAKGADILRPALEHLRRVLERLGDA